MKRIVLSTILAVSLLITSCSASNTETTSVTTEATTEATTTTTAETTTEATTVRTFSSDPISSLSDVCSITAKALKNNNETALTMVEDAFAKEFELLEERPLPENEKTPYKYTYKCDVLIEGYLFTQVVFWCNKDHVVTEIDYDFYSSDKNTQSDYYKYISSKLSKVFKIPGEDFSVTSDFKIKTFEPGDGYFYAISNTESYVDSEDRVTLSVGGATT